VLERGANTVPVAGFLFLNDMFTTIIAELGEECLHQRKCSALRSSACGCGRYATAGGCYKTRYGDMGVEVKGN
jgi:hypothetical protein